MITVTPSASSIAAATLGLLLANFMMPHSAHAQDDFTVSSGVWAAALETPGGAIEFNLKLQQAESGKWTALVMNPLEPVVIPEVDVQGDSVKLGFSHYNSTITAKLADGILKGSWTKQRGGGKSASLAFRATAGGHSKPNAAVFKPYVGRWKAVFSESDDPAIGQFAVNDAGVPWGTFLTTTGDYRFLVAQSVTDKEARLSCFDGSHAFLFSLRPQDDGSLAGDFWSGGSWHESLTASRDEEATLPDAFLQSRTLQGVNLSDLTFPGIDGKNRSLADPKFAGRCRIIQVFGSWCPNCHDAALYLKEINDKYGDEGLSIVGLAFEHTGEFERDVAQVKNYIARHKTPYPVLLAGTSDKAEATKQLKLLDRVRSYPTTIFLNANGQVRAVYTGFSGPATGDAYAKLRRRFEQTIERILNE